MIKTLILLSAFLIASLHAQDSGADNKRPTLYPFDVTIGGQKAVMQEGNILFAVIENPVKPDALLEIEQQAPMLIINAFKVNEKGEVMQPGQQPAIIFARNTQSTKLDATMDKQQLQAGRYLANIVANGTTSRVVFVVEDKSGKFKVPSLKSLVDYLKKKQ
ncbi:hypothetical protein JIN77_04000 [Verrucomicrobiaceae bacterium R5-34]|uniref:DUF4426 domain-containing protein n=1 Tax=Oceaniferula flava TaxID=2800421 RepID=A0AAE2SGB7_9BACT|nr:hypothetical protein [Oceaniferula flavus]MBK1829874.1 hypothetical protein [Verrucomicrobiaceae bacterium R5-34]MBK1856344.1 hypothetical protein [Oceaniferula flavus]MBM1137651.1 hypothetical protein [Oceaniferula flavus]